MTTCHALLLGLLVYVTLDLSLPSMPGAFVFDAGDSVESVQMSRAREGRTVISCRAPTVVAEFAAVARPAVNGPRAPRRVPRRALTRVPRDTVAAEPVSEESH